MGSLFRTRFQPLPLAGESGGARPYPRDVPLRFDDPTVAPLQVILHRHHRGFWLENLESPQAVSVNDIKLRAGGVVPLSHRTLLAIGGTCFMLSLHR